MQIKKLTSVTLAVTMMVSLCSVNIVTSTTTKADSKTVFDEIAEVNISERKLDKIEEDNLPPGSSVFMLNKNSGTWYGSGTSMASPVVAAVAAIMCSVNADLNYFDVKRIMANTATDLAEDITKDKVPYGIVNAAKSVQYAVDYTPNTLFKFELEPYQNLAYKKNVSASSLYNSDDFPLTNLVDGDTRSKIITGSSAGQYVEVDLGEVCDIDKINLIYDRYSTTAYSIKVSEDHEEWIEIDCGDKEPQTGKLLEFEKRKARYVKVDFIDNDTYVVLLELEVYGYIQEPIQYKDILNEKEKPSDVLNMTANWIFPGAVRVAWKEDANRASKDYTYNIYVNDRLSRSQVTETNEILTGFYGTYTFKVTACLNGYESEGVEIRTYVGNTMPTTTTETPTTTSVPVTTQIPTTTPIPITETSTTPDPTTTGADEDLLEVIGMVASCPADNTIGVVWGRMQIEWLVDANTMYILTEKRN